MSDIFLIIWFIVAILLLGFEFHAEQEFRRASSKNKVKISNYKRCGLWNIILSIFFIATIIYFSIVDFHNFVGVIMICGFQLIRTVTYAVLYYTKKISYKSSDTTTDATNSTNSTENQQNN